MRLTMAEAKALGLQVNEKRRPPSIRNGSRPTAPTTASGAGCKLFLAACKAHGLPVPVAEYQFAPPRRWKFDWLFEGWLALEIQGGLFTNGRHCRGADLVKEHEKLNTGVVMGYAVLFCTPQDVESGAAFALVARALTSHGEQP